jgi:hypothetical protein
MLCSIITIGDIVAQSANQLLSDVEKDRFGTHGKRHADFETPLPSLRKCARGPVIETSKLDPFEHAGDGICMRERDIRRGQRAHCAHYVDALCGQPQVFADAQIGEPAR